MNHTEGPYKLVERKTDYAIKTKDGCQLATVMKFPEGAILHPQAAFNAKLFNGAPVMLSALEKIDEIIEAIGERDDYDPGQTLMDIQALVEKGKRAVR